MMGRCASPVRERSGVCQVRTNYSLVAQSLVARLQFAMLSAVSRATRKTLPTQHTIDFCPDIGRSGRQQLFQYIAHVRQDLTPW